MDNGENISGQKIGKLTAIKRAGKDKNGRIMWLCKCDCGNLINVSTTDLRAGRRKSCGCLKKERHNLVGQRFGKLTVIRKDTYGTHAKYLCRCDCGREIVVRGDSLVGGKTVSCGCSKRAEDKIDLLRAGRKLDDHTSGIFFKGTISKNNTSGINGVSRLKSGKYRAYIGYKNKVYSLIEDYNINIAREVREKAEQAVKDGVFEEWIKKLKEDR